MQIPVPTAGPFPIIRTEIMSLDNLLFSSVQTDDSTEGSCHIDVCIVKDYPLFFQKTNTLSISVLLQTKQFSTSRCTFAISYLSILIGDVKNEKTYATIK